jgi:hypothetical protein
MLVVLPRTYSHFKWIGLLLVVAVVAGLAWSLFGLQVSEPGGPITASEAQAIVGITLPPEAKNIRAASYSQWIEYGQYLRFEAPVPVCLRCASRIVPGATTQPVDSFDLARASRSVRADAFKDLSWFDLAKAKNVITAGGGPSQAQIWVDRRRGVFYYRKTD